MGVWLGGTRRGGPEADVDLPTDFGPGRSLLEHAALLQDLQDILDVVNDKALHDCIRDRVLQEATPL